jgi:hypothetical protein
MDIILARVACFFLACKPNPDACFCDRCGRKKHLWVETPEAESSDFELAGRNSRGGMIYMETVRNRYTCSRCGESYVKTTRKYVHH